MSEYTKIETARSIICDMCECLYPDGYCPEKCDWMEHLKEDAADVAPVVHGRWIKPPLWGIGVCACSHCKDKSQIFVFSNGEISEKFCPLCGARMDGDSDG